MKTENGEVKTAPVAPKVAPKGAEQPVEKVSEVLKVSKVEGEEAKA